MSEYVHILFSFTKKSARVWHRPASLSIFARFGRALAMTHVHGYGYLSSPLPNAHWVLASLSLPLPNAQSVLAHSSSFAQHDSVFSESRLIPFHWQSNAILRNPALHDSGIFMIQAPLVTHRCRVYMNIGLLQKYRLKSLQALLSLFEYLSFFPLRNLLHHFLVSIQRIACAYSVAHLPPYCITTLLRHSLRRSLCSKHDFFVSTSSLLRKLCFLYRKLLWLPMGHYLVKARRSSCTLKSRLRFKYNRLSPISVNKMICLLQAVLIAATTMVPTSHHAELQNNLGGGALRSSFTFAQLSEHLVVPVEEILDQIKDSVFRYAAHVNEADLLKYPCPAYIHCKIPLEELVPMLTVVHARKIISLHGLSPGSRCTQKHILKCIENHSCLCCSSYFTVFSVEEGSRKLGSKRVAKYKASKKLDPSESTEPSTYDFPPEPADANLINTILSKSCNKMQPMYLQEGGCAVCGELKPVRELRCLKGIKNILSVLEAPGVTRVERKKTSSSVKGYAGPVDTLTIAQTVQCTTKTTLNPVRSVARDCYVTERSQCDSPRGSELL